MTCGKPVDVPGLELGSFDVVPCKRAEGHEPPCRSYPDAPVREVGADEVPAVEPAREKPSPWARLFLISGAGR
jgi:hypothetical protein